jgi:putative spermidine/putrescine transport system substrate-binding protein
LLGAEPRLTIPSVVIAPAPFHPTPPAHARGESPQKKQQVSCQLPMRQADAASARSRRARQAARIPLSDNDFVPPAGTFRAANFALAGLASPRKRVIAWLADCDGTSPQRGISSKQQDARAFERGPSREGGHSERRRVMFLRRATATALAVAGLTWATAADAQRPPPERTTITFFYWAGSNQGVVPNEVITAYRQANPQVTIEILESNNMITYPRMVAARRTTPDSPLVHCGFFNVDSITRGDVDDMWESFSEAGVPNLANVPRQYHRPQNRGVGYQMSAIGILYNRNRVQTPPTSWAVLWDPANRGRVTMFDYDTRALVLAARLNGGDENNIDPGFRVWAQSARNFRALVDSNDALKNLLVSGDAWYAPWFGAISQIWINEGAPLAFAIPREGAIAFPLYLVMARGVTPAQRRVCEDLINTLLEPGHAGRYGQLTLGVPLVRNAVISEEQRRNPMFDPQVAETAIVPDYSIIARNTAAWRERWDREVKIRMR